MKKIFLGISMVLLSAIGFSAAAQTQQAKVNNENCVKEQCDRSCKGDKAKKDKKGDRKSFGKKHGKKHGEFRGQRDGRNRAFEGIELTATQKTQIEALNKKMAEERKALRDDAAARTAEARQQAKKAGEEARLAYNTSIKEILTTEQYTKYQANREAMKVRKEAKKEMKAAKSELKAAKRELKSEKKAS